MDWSLMLSFFIGCVVGQICILFLKDKFCNKDSPKDDPFKIPKRPKDPLYFKFRTSEIFIKVIDYDDTYYKFVYNIGLKKWNDKIEIETIKRINDIYTKINFNPLE